MFGGTAWSLPLPLTLRQEGEEALRFTARWSTRPLEGSPYYAYRLGRGEWSATLVHHKLYLENPPPEVERFEVSHGYNLAMLERARPARGATLRLGLGVVIAHPEGRVRGREVGPVRSLLGGGYHLSGISAQVALSRAVEVTDHLYLVPEAKLTGATSRVPLAGGGWASVPNLALHLLGGVGFRR